MFLATIPSPVARWSLLTRCLSDLEQTTDATEQAVAAAEIVSARLDRDSLRLIRDTLRSEYIRTEMEHTQQGRILYGLLSRPWCSAMDRTGVNRSTYGHCCPLSPRASRPHSDTCRHPVSQRREYPPVFFL